jgi:hypothetical protein
MSNLIPHPMSKATLLTLIEDIREHVEADDSWEGWIEYTMPENGEADFQVRASYRIGNLGGQGGMRMIGKVPGT